MANKLDRISLGHFENEEGLEKKGKVCFKLHVHRNEGPYWQGEYFDHYYITGKLSTGEKVFDQSIGSTKLIDKQRFFEEVNDDLAQMNCYLTEAEHHKRLPIFSLQCVKGILYKEQIK